jgi:2-keto-4-pentenoate hydratase/2-oxohepta-3-ene-1,7-dioic acid hydratase in catechol pathway
MTTASYSRLFCVGYNYRSHASEVDVAVPDHPTFFLRTIASVTVGDGPIELPRVSPTLDWEGEAAVVIGTPGRHITPEHALKHVAGVVPFGDHSVREFQMHGTQATAAKNFDRSGSIGSIVTPLDEIEWQTLEVITKLNGEQVQHGCLADLVFGVPQLIAYISQWTRLERGDVIATGTPSGIGARNVPPRWLCAGDEISVSIPGFGQVTNTVVEESK